MGLKWPKSGYKNAPSYELSGVPFIFATSASANSATSMHGIHNYWKGSGSHPRKWIPVHVKFPFVARWFAINNTEPNNRKIAVAFTVEGLLSGSFITIDKFEWDVFDYAAELGVTDLFLASTSTAGSQFSLIAGLTNIPRDQAPVFSGSTGFEGMGYGGTGRYDPLIDGKDQV